MRIGLIVLFLFLPLFAEAASAKIKKVLPHYVDKDGRHTLSPSLYERDAYQAEMRRKPELRSGLRFDVQWDGTRKVPMILRVELRGSRSGTATTADIQSPVRGGWFSKWSSAKLSGDAYTEFGELVAWRTSIWAGDQLLAEQRSFLW